MDPFAHHPELRDLIKDPETSFFRNLDLEDLARRMRQNGAPDGWMLSDEERDAGRHALLARAPAGDLWVFAYGSLMWDPGIRFGEVRRAYVADHARRFILKDTLGGRGTPECPGLMAALDRGPGCHGLAFRIAEVDIPGETDRLWRRERIGPAYIEACVETRLSDRTVTAVTFVADHDADLICPDLSWEDTVRCAATGTGFLGSSLEYVAGLSRNFAALGIEDAEVTALYDAARSYCPPD